MQEATEHLTVASEAGGLSAAALQAEAWAGEPFLHPEEDPGVVLVPGTARRRALDDAVAEMETGAAEPSYGWKIRYALMLGLERVLSERPPKLASGTELRRHQIDALAGMLTELIAATQVEPELNGNGNGIPVEEAEVEPEDEEEDLGVHLEAPADDLQLPEEHAGRDPGASRRYRFRHPTASGKTIAAAGFVEAARTLGVLILTHRRLLVTQFHRELTAEGYGERFTDAITKGQPLPRANPVTVQTYAWFARHWSDLDPKAYQLVICDEAHTALGEKTSAAIRSFSDPIFIGMTATEQLIAKQVSDVFPASIDELPLGDAARRGLIAPLRCLRVPPAAAISSVPIVGGDFEERALAAVLDHTALNQAAASLYRDRFDNTPGIVYAAGVDHAYNLAKEFRAAGLKADGGQRPHAAGAARRDAGRLRARRDQHPDQRDAARRGLELTARDGRHAPGADGVEARLPAADRPDHAHAPAQGGRRRRRLRPQGRNAQRAGRLAAQPARRRLLPRGRARDAGPAPTRAAPRPPEALAGAVARAGDAGRQAPPRRDHPRVAARSTRATSTTTSSSTGRRSPAATSASTNESSS